VLALGEAGQTEVWANTQLQFIAHTDNMQQVVQYYQAADLYVHASKADTFPNTVLEAMACGIAVVASHVGGIPEQVSDGITGLLVAPENSQALAIAIETLLAQETLRSTMGQAGRKRVLGEFQLSQQIDRYLEWYEAILDLQRGAPRIAIKN
jgi:glycosyltransferase involved in cell wall biosynthesis